MKIKDHALVELRKNLHPRTAVQNIAIVVFSFTVVIPAMTLWGASGVVHLFGFIRALPLAALFATSAVGGALACALYYPKPGYWKLGIVPGAIIGPCILASLLLYTSWREHIIGVELMIPFLVGGAPGYFLYRFLLLRRERQERPTLPGSPASRYGKAL